MNQDEPDFRATIVRGRLTLVGWHRGLMRPGGPCAKHFRQRGRAGVVVADIRVLRDEDPWELVVEVLSGELDDDAREAIVDWAGVLGYGRVWLPDLVVEPEADPSLLGGRAGARCPSCRSRWENDAWDFWQTVRGWGHFPLACPLCGTDLPQWTVAPR